MSSKNVPDSFFRSFRLKLTLLHVGLTVLTIAIAFGTSYWVLERNTRQDATKALDGALWKYEKEYRKFIASDKYSEKPGLTQLAEIDKKIGLLYDDFVPLKIGKMKGEGYLLVVGVSKGLLVRVELTAKGETIKTDSMKMLGLFWEANQRTTRYGRLLGVVWNEKGVLLAGTDGMGQDLSGSDADLLHANLQSTQVETLHFRGAEYYYVAKLIPELGQCGLCVRVDTAHDAVVQLRQTFVILLCVLVPIVILIGWLVASRAMAGVGRVTKAAETIMAGDFSHRVPSMKEGVEIEQLAGSFNRMLDHIQVLVQGLRDITSNVAHDLRTPITRIRTNLETADWSCSAPEHIEVAGEVIEECDRLVALINVMLEICEAESDLLKLKLEEFDVVAEIRNAVDLFSSVSEDKNILVTCDLPETPLMIHYSHPHAINEELFLVSRADHPVSPQGRVPPADGRAIFLIDAFGGRTKIYEDPEVASVSPIAIRPRKRPPVLPSALNVNAEKTGTVFLQNVYLTRNDPEGIIKPGMIKAIRVNALGVQPRASRTKLSATVPVEIPKKVLGTVPVTKDGSAMFTAPANVALQIQSLDENGMAILTERSFFYLQPGERRSCVGCHEPVGAPPNMQAMARMGKMKTMKLKPAAGPQYKGGMSFVRTVQPVLDRHCIKCHGLDGKKKGKVDFVYNGRGGYSDSMMQIIKRGDHKVGEKAYTSNNYDNEKLSNNISRPRKFYAYENKVAQMLAKGDKNHKKLIDRDREGYMRIIEWLDLNAQAFGDLFPNKIEDRQIDHSGMQKLKAYVKELFGDKIARQPDYALVNVVQPGESRILNMPLPVDKGGWGQIKGYSSKTDPKYKKMAELVEACIRRKKDENINGWEPTVVMGGGEKWVVEARAKYLAQWEKKEEEKK